MWGRVHLQARGSRDPLPLQVCRWGDDDEPRGPLRQDQPSRDQREGCLAVPGVATARKSWPSARENAVSPGVCHGRSRTRPLTLLGLGRRRRDKQAFLLA